MAREYKAFISYRHLPADIDTAVRLHRIIERFTIPRALRKNGMKKPGFVFRDQDELPLSSDLSGSIREALDRSEFLIVICSPETPKSLWVLREISYFLENHDRDHVLTVLVDGRPEESFPELLTQVYDESGNVIDHIEPLGANIVAESPGKRHRLLKTESLRIIAALIGCAFDELYRRQQRYRRRLIAAAGTVFAAIVSAFLGMLLVKNAQIEEQLRLSQINESKALAALSKTEYGEGDYARALEYALAALPAEGISRPYVPAAEEALVHALNPYAEGFKFIQSYEQDTDIKTLEISADGSCFATADSYGNVRLVDTARGSVIWETDMPGLNECKALYILDDSDVLLADLSYETMAYSLGDGELLWRNDSSFAGFLNDGESCICYSFMTEEFVLVDASSGEIKVSAKLSEDTYWELLSTAVAEDGSCCAFLLENFPQKKLLLWDLEQNTIAQLPPVLEKLYRPDGEVQSDFALKILENGDLLIAKVDPVGDTQLLCLDSAKQWEEKYFVSVPRIDNGTVMKNGTVFTDEVKLLDSYENSLYICTMHQIYAFDAGTGEEIWQVQLPELLAGVRMYVNGSIGLSLIDGTLCFCYDGNLSLEGDPTYYSAGFDVAEAEICGDVLFESVFALQSSKHSGQLTVIKRIVPDEESFIFENSVSEGYSIEGLSPSGKLFAELIYIFEDDSIKIKLIDSGEDYCITEYVFPNAGSFASYGNKLYVDNEGKLYVDGTCFELSENRVLGLSGDGSIPDQYGIKHAYGQSRDGKLLTAAVFPNDTGDDCQLLYWEDGTLMEELAVPQELAGDNVFRVNCCAVGGEGTVIISGLKEGKAEYHICNADRGSWVSPPEDVDGAGSVAISVDGKRAAFAVNDGIAIVDTATGKILQRTEERLPTESVCKMLFVCENRYLLCFLATGDVLVVDVQSGAVVSRNDCAREYMDFSDENCSYSSFVSKEGDRVFVICNDLTYGSLCICFDTDTMELAAAYKDVLAYIPEHNEVLVYTDHSDLYRKSLYSLEDMMDMARAVLSRTEHKNGTVK